MPVNVEPIHFPVDTGDQAQLNDPKTLLAREVYEQISSYLHVALEKSQQAMASEANENSVFDRWRSHDAILLDGGRGTGKSSVLVNLPLYLSSDQRLKDGLLILKPVDPTLLENGDDLFLNVIVAALMRDPVVRSALRQNHNGTEKFYKELEALGSALEGIQKIGNEYGLDKLRAFVENQELAEHVHRLFHSALLLTEKRLIVLPIDDVDTSLELAFENVEVVRKYLTSPYVLPLVTGDLRLYDDVIYRQFAQRLLGTGKIDHAGALERARGLAEEYERKVLPLPRRIRLPSLQSYLNDRNIHLADQGEPLIALPLFKHWLEAVFNDRVNGEENSFRRIPLRTVREFAQFIQTTRNLLPALKQFVVRNNIAVDGSGSAIAIRRSLVMTPDVASAVTEFARQYGMAFSIRRDETRTQRTARERAYRALRDAVSNTVMAVDQDVAHLRLDWNEALASYALHQRHWGSTFLIADANVHLLRAEGDVLGHDLFKPQHHAGGQYTHFDEAVEFGSVWQELLTQKAPEQWLARLPKTTLLSYPGPETGTHVGRVTAKSEGDPNFTVQLYRKLLVHWSYYSRTQRGDLLLCGRMFELLVASLTCELTVAEVLRILNRPPFYSLAAFAKTKTLDFGESIEDEGEQEAEREPDDADGYADRELAFEGGVADLVQSINLWRRKTRVTRPSAWFVFVVMNKFFSQTQYINPSLGNLGHDAGIARLVAQVFNLFLSAVGSFEKGELFGLPQIVATVNMPRDFGNFARHPLYIQNVAPFLQLRENDGYADFGTNAYTYALESHPIRLLSMDLGSSPVSQPSTNLNLQVLNPTETDSIDRRIDRYVNVCRRRFDLVLSTKGINEAPPQVLEQFLKAVMDLCEDGETLARMNAIVKLEVQDLPPNSGRRRLQRVVYRLGR